MEVTSEVFLPRELAGIAVAGDVKLAVKRKVAGQMEVKLVIRRELADKAEAVLKGI